MTHVSRSVQRVLLTLALLTSFAPVTGCGGLIQYNSGETTQQARDAAVAETGLALCDPLDLANIGFEEPVLPGEMLYNSYPFLAGWRSPHGEMLVGRGNLGIDAIPDNAAYGDQHAILKPRRAGEVRAQAHTAIEYALQLEVGKRYALVLSAMSPQAGNEVTLTMVGTELSPYAFSAPTAWRQRVVPFTAREALVVVRVETGETRPASAPAWSTSPGKTGAPLRRASRMWQPGAWATRSAPYTCRSACKGVTMWAVPSCWSCRIRWAGKL